MEMLDIVDENDKVVGKIDVKKCHDKNFLHRSSSILVFRDKSREEMVIQKRSKYMVNKPGLWAQISGHVTSGETYMECAQKELKEEMFHDMEMPPLEFTELFKIRKDSDGDPEFMMVYETIYDGEFSLEPREAEAYKYVSIGELLQDTRKNPGKYTGTFIMLLKEYLKRSG